MARANSNINYERLARRARKVVRLTLPIMGRHRGFFVKGVLAAVIVASLVPAARAAGADPVHTIRVQ